MSGQKRKRDIKVSCLRSSALMLFVLQCIHEPACQQSSNTDCHVRCYLPCGQHSVPLVPVLTWHCSPSRQHLLALPSGQVTAYDRG